MCRRDTRDGIEAASGRAADDGRARRRRALIATFSMLVLLAAWLASAAGASAFSAHGITITPGELVIDFDGSRAMYVHCLDVEASAASAPGAQAKRLKLLRRIAGRG